MPEPTSFSVATVNLNGIRAAYRRGFADWLEMRRPDVLLLQEVRADESLAADLLGEEWDSTFHASSIKGRAGVGVAIRADSQSVARDQDAAVVRGLREEEEPVDSGRWLEVDLVTAAGTRVRAVSAYFHAGQANHPKQDAKMAHMEPLSARFETLLAESGDGPQALVGGDYNIVRSEQDIKNWKPNYNKTSGVLDEEIAYLNRWADQGWVDVVRELAGPVQGPYSWWAWRGKAFDNDAGWRIDYHYATPQLGQSATSYVIDRAGSWDTRVSDHAPVTVTYRL